jgi:hypothetical protein
MLLLLLVSIARTVQPYTSQLASLILLCSGDSINSFDHLLTTRIPRRPSNIRSLPTRARDGIRQGIKLPVYLRPGVIHRLDHALQFVRHFKCRATGVCRSHA